MRPFAREVRDEAQRRGILPFDALLALSRDLLANHPRVRRELAQRYRVLFLDEFQDTDPLQYEIVFLLAGRVRRRARSPPGKLFIVGDPKQAIYRFRGADIGAYESAVERVLDAGGARLALTENFRSRPEILEPLDRAVSAHLPRPEPGRVGAGRLRRVRRPRRGARARGRAARRAVEHRRGGRARAMRACSRRR